MTHLAGGEGKGRSAAGRSSHGVGGGLLGMIPSPQSVNIQVRCRKWRRCCRKAWWAKPPTPHA